jgi:hypothetical protein
MSRALAVLLARRLRNTGFGGDRDTQNKHVQLFRFNTQKPLRLGQVSILLEPWLNHFFQDTLQGIWRHVLELTFQ